MYQGIASRLVSGQPAASEPQPRADLATAVATRPPSRKERKALPTTDYSDILRSAIERHANDPIITAAQVADISRQVDARLQPWERRRLERETGMDSLARTRQELQAMRDKQKQERAEISSLDPSRIEAGLPPAGQHSQGYMDAATPLVDLIARDRAQKKAEQEYRARQDKRVRLGVTDPEKWSAEDMLAWDEGKLPSITNIKPVPLEVSTLSSGGRTFYKAPPGYTELKPEKETKDDSSRRAFLYGELNAIRSQRLSMGQDLTKILATIESVGAKLKHAKSSKYSDPDAVADLEADLSSAHAQKAALKKRDESLTNREMELRQEVGDSGKPMASEFAEPMFGGSQQADEQFQPVPGQIGGGSAVPGAAPAGEESDTVEVSPEDAQILNDAPMTGPESDYIAWLVSKVRSGVPLERAGRALALTMDSGDVNRWVAEASRQLSGSR